MIFENLNSSQESYLIKLVNIHLTSDVYIIFVFRNKVYGTPL